jgi:hypothetical protein
VVEFLGFQFEAWQILNFGILAFAMSVIIAVYYYFHMRAKADQGAGTAPGSASPGSP